MKNILYFTVLLLAPVLSHAQSFQKTYGGRFAGLIGYSLVPTYDNGFLVTGSGQAANGPDNANVLLIKTNNEGDTLWTRAMGGSRADNGYFALQTADSGFLAGGDTYSFGAGNADAYLLKTDKNGKLLWSKTYGGPANEDITGARPTADGGFLVLGSTSSFGAGDFDIYLLRINALGDTLWTRTIGGPKADFGLCLQETADKGFIISGYTQSFGAGEDDVLLLKTDENGRLMWLKTYGGTSSDAGSAVLQTQDGGYVICGKTHSFRNPLDGDAYLIRTDNNGDTLWTRQYGSPRGTEWAHGLVEQENGDLLMTGDTYSFGAGHSDVYVLHTDRNGLVIDSKTYGSTSFDYGRSIWQHSDGSYVIGAQTSGFGEENLSLLLIKEERFNGNENCNQEWATTESYPTPTVTGTVVPVVSSSPTRSNNAATRAGSGMSVHHLCLSGTAVEATAVATKVPAIFPNPTTGIFHTQLPKEHSVTVYDISGRTVYRQILQAAAHEVNLGSLVKGVYIVALSAADGVTTYGRIQLQ